jgi:hypothetical protein
VLTTASVEPVIHLDADEASSKRADAATKVADFREKLEVHEDRF